MNEDQTKDSTPAASTSGPNRRKFLAGAVVATGAAWAAPAIRSSHNVAWAAGTVADEHYGGMSTPQYYDLPANRTVEFVLVGGGGGAGQNTYNVDDAGWVDTGIGNPPPSRVVQEGAGPGRNRNIGPGDGRGGRGGAGTRLEGTFATGSSPMRVAVRTGSAGTQAPRVGAAAASRGGAGGAGYTNGANGGLGLYRSNSLLWNGGDVGIGPNGFFELTAGAGGGGGGSSAIWSVDSGGNQTNALEIIAPGGGGGGGAGSAWAEWNNTTGTKTGPISEPLDYFRPNGEGYRVSSAGGHGGDAVSSTGPQSGDVNGTTGQAGIPGYRQGGGSGSDATGAGAGGTGGSSGAGDGTVGQNAATVTSGSNGYVGGGGGGGGGGWSGGHGGSTGTPGTGSTQGTPGGGGGGSGSMRIHGANTPVTVVNPTGNEPGPPNSGSVVNNQYAGQWGPRDFGPNSSVVPAQSWPGNPGYFRIYLQ